MLSKITFALAASLSPLLLAAAIMVGDSVATPAEAQQRVTVFVDGRLVAVGRTVRNGALLGFRNGGRGSSTATTPSSTARALSMALGSSTARAS